MPHDRYFCEIVKKKYNYIFGNTVHTVILQILVELRIDVKTQWTGKKKEWRSACNGNNWCQKDVVLFLIFTPCLDSLCLCIHQLYVGRTNICIRARIEPGTYEEVQSFSQSANRAIDDVYRVPKQLKCIYFIGFTWYE